MNGNIANGTVITMESWNNDWYSDLVTLNLQVTVYYSIPCAVVAGTSSSSVTTGCGSTNTTLSLAGEGAGSIQWQTSTDGGATWSNIGGGTTDPYVHNTSVSRLYRAAVTNGCTSYSTTSSITISCDIIHPASGFVSNTISCGASYTYRDPGGTSDYSNNQNGLLTICPSVPGQYVSISFSQFSLDNNYDYIIVHNGSDPGSDIIGLYTGTSLPGSITSSVVDGCLSIRFYSDGADNYSGWQATVTCTATPGPPSTGSPQDCAGGGGTTICSNSNLTANSSGLGTNELMQTGFWGESFPWAGCLWSGERQSTWYYFSPATSGTIGLNISPAVPTDYDFAIWGPYTDVSCPAFTGDSPYRCSYADRTDATGLGNSAIDLTEDDWGNGWVAPMNVTAGEVYVLLISNYDASNQAYTLSWNLTNGATLDCTPLPVTMSSFVNTCENGKTLLKWTTETNNDYFAIEKSDEKFQFYEIGRVFGSGNSNVSNYYSFTDPTFNNKTTYYRIKQVDFNGEHTYHKVVASNCYKTEFEVVNQQLTSNNLNLIVNSFEDENVIIYLYDLQGRLILESNYQLTQGNNKINLNHVDINSGIYLLNLKGEVHYYQTKLIRK